ncbi:MAG: hypothetical protein KatS3mg029_0103 [Saprospiraceae bacterium]|nr:MAG: hypothetical protein KatS3mg029_0098 [Saprospiraceae bacterium]GIV30752.1 MAG: hypothetical protein KatS3mg029_0103 [Saprospiraceae bacterium]
MPREAHEFELLLGEVVAHDGDQPNFVEEIRSSKGNVEGCTAYDVFSFSSRRFDVVEGNCTNGEEAHDVLGLEGVKTTKPRRSQWL